MIQWWFNEILWDLPSGIFSTMENNYATNGKILTIYVAIFTSYVKLPEGKWCPRSIAKLVYNSDFTMVYGTFTYC